MKLSGGQRTLLDGFMDHFLELVGDRRTGRLLKGVVQGIIGAESLVCSRIAVFSPSDSHGQSEWRATDQANG